VERAEITFDDTVVVAGCGPIGLGMVAGARAKSPAHVVALDLAPQKLELAKECGADVVINIGNEDAIAIVNDLTDGYGADVYLEGTGHPSAVIQGLNLLRKLGTYVEYGVFGSDASVDWSIISDDKELTVLGAHLGPHCWPGCHPDDRVRVLADGQDLHPSATAHGVSEGPGSGGERYRVGQGIPHPVISYGQLPHHARPLLAEGRGYNLSNQGSRRW
jgi:threonine dehydrogenase-like Zn-dependent dehydrogenase